MRAHLSHLGHPVLGDSLYGPDDLGGGGGLDVGLHLHAWKVCFRHPTSGQSLEIVAPPPPWAGEIAVNLGR